MFQRSLFRDEQIEPLADGVFTVLERVGILCQNEGILKALESAGAKVDYASQRATFPKRMVEEFVDVLRKEASKEGQSGHRKFISPTLPHLGTQVAQFFYDYEKDERRSGNRTDFITLIKLGDVLHPEVGVGHCLLLTDVPPLIEPLEAAMLLAEYAHRPAPAFAWNVRQVDYLIEMGEILGMENWFTWGAICFAHPLRFDRDVADRFVRRVKAGVPTGLTAMPVASVTAPVTVEGFVVVTSAEHIATWIAARALNPEIQLTGSMWAGTVDMKTGEVSFSSFDAMFYSFATVEFLRRWCGKNIPVGGGEYCDAKRPGLYAALEKAYKAMTIAAFTGHHPPIGQGMLEKGKTISPVQLLLERDLGIGVRHFARGVEPADENIAIATILDVGIALERSYLDTEHTLHHYRSSLWLPELIERSGWNGYEREGDILRKAQRKVNELIAEYRKPEVDEDKLAEMRKVIQRARRMMNE
jgi:trimethylamine:corrinoid methyltransferase-like protein